MQDIIKSFLLEKNYDIRKSGNGRWIDQKCTMDVLSLVSDCIINFIQDNQMKRFTTKDIWFSQYAITNVQRIFVKPSPTNKKSSNEYDKYFGQPLKLLGYSKVLIEEKVNNKNVYHVNNLEILEYIARRDINALEFLQLYIEKVLIDSDLNHSFDDFFRCQNKDTYNLCKQSFTEFTKKYTRINGDVECGRIFAKVLNPLAFKHRKHGTERGHISKYIITYDMLQYNQPNWRDLLSNKPKEVTREEYLRSKENIALETGILGYKIQRAKNVLRTYNKLRQSLSEILDIEYHLEVKATQMHHIFPASYFPEIADSVENLIALTPNQHNIQAHPNNNTQVIDKTFQKICLIEKIERIRESFEFGKTIYSFEELVRVLNIGLETEVFSSVSENDFNSLIIKLDLFY